MYDAVVFDVDGVLLRRHPDYPDVYRSGVEEAFRAFDVVPDESDVEAFFGDESKTLEGMREVCERYGLDFASFWSERERQSAALQRRMIERGKRTLYEDVSVLSELAEMCALGLVSSNQHATIQFVVDHFDFGASVSTAYGRAPTVEGYQQIKPDTHYLDRSLDDLGTRNALYVGDGAQDVVAAHRAALDSTFVRRPHREEYELPEEPTYEIDDLTELSGLVTDN